MDVIYRVDQAEYAWFVFVWLHHGNTLTRLGSVPCACVLA